MTDGHEVGDLHFIFGMGVNQRSIGRRYRPTLANVDHKGFASFRLGQLSLLFYIHRINLSNLSFLTLYIPYNHKPTSPVISTSTGVAPLSLCAYRIDNILAIKTRVKEAKGTIKHFSVALSYLSYSASHSNTLP